MFKTIQSGWRHFMLPNGFIMRAIEQVIAPAFGYIREPIKLPPDIASEDWYFNPETKELSRQTPALNTRFLKVTRFYSDSKTDPQKKSKLQPASSSEDNDAGTDAKASEAQDTAEQTQTNRPLRKATHFHFDSKKDLQKSSQDKEARIDAKASDAQNTAEQAQTNRPPRNAMFVFKGVLSCLKQSDIDSNFMYWIQGTAQTPAMDVFYLHHHGTDGSASFEGLTSAAQNFANLINAYYKAFPNLSACLYGHSLGGALAILTAAILHNPKDGDEHEKCDVDIYALNTFTSYCSAFIYLAPRLSCFVGGAIWGWLFSPLIASGLFLASWASFATGGFFTIVGIFAIGSVVGALVGLLAHYLLPGKYAPLLLLYPFAKPLWWLMDCDADILTASKSVPEHCRGYGGTKEDEIVGKNAALVHALYEMGLREEHGVIHDAQADPHDPDPLNHNKKLQVESREAAAAVKADAEAKSKVESKVEKQDQRRQQRMRTCGMLSPSNVPGPASCSSPPLNSDDGFAVACRALNTPIPA